MYFLLTSVTKVAADVAYGKNALGLMIALSINQMATNDRYTAVVYSAIRTMIHIIEVKNFLNFPTSLYSVKYFVYGKSMEA